MNEIEKAIELMNKGKLVVYPTDTLYALGANIFMEEAVMKVYEVKRRPMELQLPICVSSIKEIEKYAYINEIASIMARKFLPGKLTIILYKKDIIPDYISKEKIAIRVPANKIALQLSKRFPITATSANLHGMMAPSEIKIAKKQLGKNVAMYIDAGKLHGTPSTIVDLSEGKIKVIREGAIKKEELNV